MAKDTWRSEVAEQFERCAEAIRSGKDHVAASAIGTAIGYLQQAKEAGVRGAAELLSQANSSCREDETQRFSYVPGELETLARLRHRSSE
jgi:hypothetical protein